jgi:hypothetical protein
MHRAVNECPLARVVHADPFLKSGGAPLPPRLTVLEAGHSPISVSLLPNARSMKPTSSRKCMQDGLRCGHNIGALILRHRPIPYHCDHQDRRLPIPETPTSREREMLSVCLPDGRPTASPQSSRGRGRRIAGAVPRHPSSSRHSALFVGCSTVAKSTSPISPISPAARADGGSFLREHLNEHRIPVRRRALITGEAASREPAAAIGWGMRGRWEGMCGELLDGSPRRAQRSTED